LEAILALKQRTLTVKELKIFLPFSINLDPYVKKVIRDEYVSLAALEGSETGFGWFNDQTQEEAVHHQVPVPVQVVPRKAAQENQQQLQMVKQQPSSPEVITAGNLAF
jgi:hypothetical protein